MNRLSSAQEKVGAAFTWGQAYIYDRFGNRWVQPGSSVIDPTSTPNEANDFNSANNRFSTTYGPNVAYDAAGNLTRDALGRTFTYDAENRQITASPGPSSYGYDGDGRRVRKTFASGSVLFIYDAFGKLISENGGGDFGTLYVAPDPLGSSRISTTSSAGVRSRTDYLPFGQEIPAAWGRTAVGGYGTDLGLRQKFTGQIRDPETVYDYFGARYFSGAQGRFTSVDPGNAGSDASDPQSWNGYAYVRNNPLKYTDPDGLAYTICDLKGNCQEGYSDADFNKNFLGDPNVRISNSGDVIRDGKVIGTVERTSFDDLSAFANDFYRQMSNQRETTKQLLSNVTETRGGDPSQRPPGRVCWREP